MQAILYYISLPFIYLLSLLPFSILHLISDGVFFLVFHVFKYRRAVAWKNLKNSFPEKSEEELRKIEREFYGILCDYIIESLKAFSITRETALSLGQVKNPEILQKYKANNQNIIITTGHVGSQEMVNFFMSCSPDFPLTVKAVYRRLNNPYFEKKFRTLRQKFGSMLFPTQESYEMIKRQDEGRPYGLILVNDQAATPSRAYWTDFLHQETCFFQGAENFAREYNLPVYYMWVSRTKRGHFALEFILITENPSEVPQDYISETHARLLEKNILENPPIWLWSHKRWKHRKDGK